MTEHQRLLQLVKRLPGDYSDYGGTVVRWADPERSYPDCSQGCRYARWLEGELGSDWCVCTNPASHRVGLLTFEHQAGFGCFVGPMGASVGSRVVRDGRVGTVESVRADSWGEGPVTVIGQIAIVRWDDGERDLAVKIDDSVEIVEQ